MAETEEPTAEIGCTAALTIAVVAVLVFGVIGIALAGWPGTLSPSTAWLVSCAYICDDNVEFATYGDEPECRCSTPAVEAL